MTPFDAFDPQHINSTVGSRYGAFFFAKNPETAMSYMQSEEDLKPRARALYDDYMATFKKGEADLLARANELLTNHGLPVMSEFRSISLDLIRLKAAVPPDLKAGLDTIEREYNRVSSYRNAALDLYNSEKNIEVVRKGVLYTCEITLHQPMERDLDGAAFEKGRWRDIFGHATQTRADGVILYNCVDTADDVGSPDTIYAVFVQDQIRIVGNAVYGDGDVTDE